MMTEVARRTLVDMADTMHVEDWELLELRLTNTYVGEYAHLDKWREIGRYRVLHRASVGVEDDAGYLTNYWYLRVEVERNTDPNIKPWHLGWVRLVDVDDALQHTFTRVGCAHEYDCCGCWSSVVDKVFAVDDDTWIVAGHSYQNY